MDRNIYLKKLITALLIITVLVTHFGSESCVDEEIQEIKTKQEDYAKRIIINNLTIQQNEAEIRVLQFEVKEAQMEIVKWNAIYFDLLAVISLFRNQIAILGRQISNLWKLVAAGGLSQGMIKLYMPQIAYLSQKILNLKEKLEPLVEEGLNAKKKMKNLWTKYYVKKAKIEGLNSENDLLRYLNEKNLKKLNELAEKKNILKAKLKSLERQIALKEDEIENLKAELESLKSDLAAEKGEEKIDCPKIAALQAAISAKESAISSAEADLKELDAEHGC